MSSEEWGNILYFVQLGEILDHPDIPGVIMTYLLTSYLEWCGKNNEKPFSDSNLGKKFAFYGTDRTHLQMNEKREYHYILDRSKIITKLYESGLGDIEEFSYTPQSDLPENEITDIPIFNVLEIIPLKIILSQPKKNIPPRDKRTDK
ncbi:hypothetical protein GLOIN_2v1877063 [Rhizophagus clarus]|uniref:DNA primase/nucleoside triphosphatase C-terminal domain-containing protein n=1 Tax=Rhizophagus clarus TaxID=94130 RepID=A0A8H3LWV3_9GLOM|nr:hypothetical protein GLOIN_2v1877063 [Rhizophagus clarus]